MRPPLTPPPGARGAPDLRRKTGEEEELTKQHKTKNKTKQIIEIEKMFSMETARSWPLSGGPPP